MRRGSRYHARTMGAGTFAAPSTSCPPGYHYVPDAVSPTAIRGIGACVKNTTITLKLKPPAPAAAAAPSPAPAAAPAPLPPLPTSAPAPAAAPAPTTDTTQAPAPAAAAAPTPMVTTTTTTCPNTWPWWWLLVAAAMGAGIGHVAARNEKKVKKNARRFASEATGRIVNRASDAALSRLFG